MALTRTNVAASLSAGPISTLTSAAFTPANNSLVVVFFTMGDGPNNTNTFTMTDSVGLTWTKRADSGATSDNYHRSAMWTAPVATGASMTVTAGTAGDAGGEAVMHIAYYTGYDVGSPVGATVGNIQDASASTFTVTLSGAPSASSEIFAGTGVDTGGGAQSLQATSGWTSVFRQDDTANIDSVTQAITGVTSTSVVFTRFASQTPNDWCACAIEIKAAASAGAVPFNPWPLLGPIISQRRWLYDWLPRPRRPAWAKRNALRWT